MVNDKISKRMNRQIIHKLDSISLDMKVYSNFYASLLSNKDVENLREARRNIKNTILNLKKSEK